LRIRRCRASTVIGREFVRWSSRGAQSVIPGSVLSQRPGMAISLAARSLTATSPRAAARRGWTRYCRRS
jgi:hypothetical protein